MAESRRMTWKTGMFLFLVSWCAAYLSVTLLRVVLIPREERACYARITVLQKAADSWSKLHPTEPLRGDLETGPLVSAGLLPADFAYDTASHYYFIGETAHGWRVKCNRHEDTPPVLRMTGVTLLALVLWVGFASWRRYKLI